MQLWYSEDHPAGVRLSLRCKRTLHSSQSRFQRIDVLETEGFGRMLLLDGLVMLTERDEFIYHEMIAHPAAFVCRTGGDVLVVGGGDGGTVRELLRHRRFDSVILCEIDQEVVEVSRRFFPSVASGLDDERVRLLNADGAKFVAEAAGRGPGFRLILTDSTDPIGPGAILFSQEYYRNCHDALAPGGIFVAQTESPFHHLELIRDTAERLKEAGFVQVHFYTAPIPTYPGGFWSWVLAVKGPWEGLDPRVFPEELAKEPETEAILARLGYYTPGIHEAAFRLPAFMERELRKE